MLTNAELDAIQRVRAKVAPPPQEVPRADAAVLVGALDRLAAVDLDQAAASLRALIDQMDDGTIKDHRSIRQRLVGALIVCELLAAGDDIDAVASRLVAP